MSKGSRRRLGDDAAYAAGYERIFGAAALRAAKRLADETNAALHGERYVATDATKASAARAEHERIFGSACGAGMKWLSPERRYLLDVLKLPESERRRLTEGAWDVSDDSEHDALAKAHRKSNGQ